MTPAETVLRRRSTMGPDPHAFCGTEPNDHGPLGEGGATPVPIEQQEGAGGDPGNVPNMEYLLCPRCGAATVGQPQCPNCGFPHRRKGGAA